MTITKKRAGLSLIEIVVVLVIIAIVLVGFGASSSSQMKRANRSDVENELSVMASNISDAYYDLGNPVYDPTDEADVARFVRFLQIMQNEYLGVTFDLGTREEQDNGNYGSLQKLNNGFYVEIADPLDTYEQRYKCWFVTIAGVDRFCMICSGGEDTVVDHELYATGDYSDDIVLVIKPKVGE